ncbi:hypothetical protein AJ79_01774 [Helicocarpus griseus UAMH5409]|uniref:Uncharacterized protein n=1 Tax=Helicocarpus griseus UAMH5409 TaxID=1447875 RepID=A0A2B7Y5Z2_9EURO|nr:hypothetical protein AJ79_01774 [Helicocarpus griseus UAMH5409]
MNARTESTMVPKEDKSELLIEVDESDDEKAVPAQVEDDPGDEEEVEKEGPGIKTSTAQSIPDSLPTITPRRPAAARTRSHSSSGVRPKAREPSPERRHTPEPSTIRPLVPPHRSTAVSPENNPSPRSQPEREFPPRRLRRTEPDENVESEITHLGHRGITQGGSFAERTSRRVIVREQVLEDLHQESATHYRAAQHAYREAEYYKRVAGSLHKELEECKKDLLEIQDEKRALGQQILDLGTVAEGVTDEVLRGLFQNTIGCAVESHSKVFGKPTGDDHERLGKLLSSECTQLLHQFGRKFYHSLLASALFRETADAVSKRYVVGAAPGISKLTRELGVEIDARSSFTFLQILEEILHLPSMGVPQRDINVWRSSFSKLLQHIPEVSEISSTSGSKASGNSELTELVDDVWSKLEPHIPPGDKGRRSLLKLLKLQANLRLKTCMSLASYEFQYHEPGTQFNPATMSIVDVTEGECEDDELRRLEGERCGRKLVVGYCFFPALYKWGNDRGFDIEKGHVVARATVLPVYEDDPFLQMQMLEGKFASSFWS